jgi:hypothetical protein
MGSWPAPPISATNFTPQGLDYKCSVVMDASKRIYRYVRTHLNYFFGDSLVKICVVLQNLVCVHI